MSAKIRIGAVSYLNTRPLVFGLEQGVGEDRIELSYSVPARLADRMIAGELDKLSFPQLLSAECRYSSPTACALEPASGDMLACQAHGISG